MDFETLVNTVTTSDSEVGILRVCHCRSLFLLALLTPLFLVLIQIYEVVRDQFNPRGSTVYTVDTFTDQSGSIESQD